MAVIQEGLFTVCKRFPDRKNQAKRLFRDSETFQGLCEDYMRCSQALRYWNQFESEEAPVRREEYAALLQDLEAEILKDLNKSK